jgi:hypothetical protein
VTEGVAKATFEEIADNWLALADQADWIEQQWLTPQQKAG